MASELLIRPANDADVATLKIFEQGVIAAERAVAPNLKEGEIEYYDIHSFIADPQIQLLVAQIKKQLVACGYARIEQAKPCFTPTHYAYLGFMYVVPELRGNNLIGKIMEELIIWSQQREVNAFKLDVYAANPAAIRAYKKMGFAPNMLEMWKA